MTPSKYLNNPHFRHAWWRLTGGYMPMVYSWLTDDERDILDQWYDETEQTNQIGEMTVPMASMLLALINGSGIRRVVQLGHYCGYSTLMMGFCLRHMATKRGLVSIDIDPAVTAFTQSWLDRAGLAEQVTLIVGDSASTEGIAQATDILQGFPQLLVIDSSHEYQHTLDELTVWYPAVADGGIIAMHDASKFATRFDQTEKGGVRRALQEFPHTQHRGEMVILNPNDHGAYLDICGLALIQKEANP